MFKPTVDTKFTFFNIRAYNLVLTSFTLLVKVSLCVPGEIRGTLAKATWRRRQQSGGKGDFWVTELYTSEREHVIDEIELHPEKNEITRIITLSHNGTDSFPTATNWWRRLLRKDPFFVVVNKSTLTEKGNGAGSPLSNII
jgi:hypothetical protein